MIERTKRLRASDLLRDFRDGHLTNDDFEDAWPESSVDRAFSAIGTMIWRYYSDTATHALISPYGLTEDARKLFDRAILFLQTEMAYEWPQASFDFTPPSGSGILDLLTAGWFRRRAERRFHRFEEGFRAAGDVDVWPFRTRDEFNRALKEVTADRG